MYSHFDLHSRLCERQKNKRHPTLSNQKSRCHQAGLEDDFRFLAAPSSFAKRTVISELQLEDSRVEAEMEAEQERGRRRGDSMSRFTGSGPFGTSVTAKALTRWKPLKFIELKPLMFNLLKSFSGIIAKPTCSGWDCGIWSCEASKLRKSGLESC